VQTWDPTKYARNARFVSNLDGALTKKLIDLKCEVVTVDSSAPLSFVDTALFAWIVFRVRSMSSGWAITGLALLALLIETPILLRLIHGIRATRAWDRFNNPAPTNWVSSSVPAGQA